jgi:hypothetical protein
MAGYVTLRPGEHADAAIAAGLTEPAWLRAWLGIPIPTLSWTGVLAKTIHTSRRLHDTQRCYRSAFCLDFFNGQVAATIREEIFDE